MDVREKLIKICFREFCDIAGDSPCGCDGCPYGEYDPDNGGCFDEYKKDKIEKLENDMDKYQKEDNGVTVQEWVSVDDRLPDLIPYSAGIAYSETVIVLTSGRKETIAVWDGSTWIAQFDCYELWGEKITHWMPFPDLPKGE